MKKPFSRSTQRKTNGKPGEKPVALTLKIDSQTYVRLSTFRARERRTAQEILTQALQEYLDRAGA
jgi:hypothetical protein